MPPETSLSQLFSVVETWDVFIDILYHSVILISTARRRRKSKIFTRGSGRGGHYQCTRPIAFWSMVLSKIQAASTQQNLMIAVSKSVAGLSNSRHVATWAMRSSCLHRALYRFVMSLWFTAPFFFVAPHPPSGQMLAVKMPWLANLQKHPLTKSLANLLVFQPAFFHCQSPRYLNTGIFSACEAMVFLGWVSVAYDVLPTQTQRPSIGLWEHHSEANQEPICSICHKSKECVVFC